MGLCVDISSGVMINESNSNMQPIATQFAVRVPVYRTIQMPLECLSGRYLGGNLCQRYYIIPWHVTLTARRKQQVYSEGTV